MTHARCHQHRHADECVGLPTWAEGREADGIRIAGAGFGGQVGVGGACLPAPHNLEGVAACHSGDDKLLTPRVVILRIQNMTMMLR